MKHQQNVIHRLFIKHRHEVCLLIIREQIPRMNSIVADYEATAYDSVQYLFRLGSRNIAFLGGSHGFEPFRERYAGYQRALRELDLPELTLSSEQNARMMAMDAANDNASDLLAELKLEFNHLRQNAITQEITEVSSGARSLKSKGR